MSAYFVFDHKTGKYVKRGMSRGEYFKKHYGGLPLSTKDQALKPPKTPTKRSSPTKEQLYALKAAKLASDQFNKKSAEQVKQFYDSLPKQPIKIDKILKSRTPVKLTTQHSVTSQYRGGSGKKKYNQAAYLAGFGMNPNIRKNQGIYKPYANGGGVRKPKYKE